jgi:hypothetical protein
MRSQPAPIGSQHQGSPNQPHPASELLDRMPPANLEAEQALLGCLLVDPGRMAEVMNKGGSGTFAKDFAQTIVEQAQRRRWLEMGIELIQRCWNDRDIAQIGEFVSTAYDAFLNDSRFPRAVRAAVTVRMADVIAEKLEWLWPGRIALGKLTLLAGDPGLGKSFLTLDLAARVSRGDVWPDDPAWLAPRGDVLLLNAEDGLEDTVRPRLDSAKADVDRVYALTAVRDAAEGENGFSLARDLKALEHELKRRPETRLIIIDPITAYLGDTTGNNNTQVRSLLSPLSTLAQEHRVAVVAITHLNKNSGGKALYRAMGSLAFVAAARAAWGVVRDPADAERRLLLPIKNNLSQETKGMAFRLLTDPVQGAASIGWFPEPLETNLDEVLQATPLGGGDAASTAAEVRQWLIEMLSAEPVPAEELLRAASEEGITPKQLRHAAMKLDVRRQKGGFLEGWIWSLK